MLKRVHGEVESKLMKGNRLPGKSQKSQVQKRNELSADEEKDKENKFEKNESSTDKLLNKRL